jgi:hypothetical protein
MGEGLQNKLGMDSKERDAGQGGVIETGNEMEGVLRTVGR